MGKLKLASGIASGRATGLMLGPAPIFPSFAEKLRLKSPHSDGAPLGAVSIGGAGETDRTPAQANVYWAMLGPVSGGSGFYGQEHRIQRFPPVKGEKPLPFMPVPDAPVTAR